jgi:hypothetical protein
MYFGDYIYHLLALSGGVLVGGVISWATRNILKTKNIEIIEKDNTIKTTSIQNAPASEVVFIRIDNYKVPKYNRK